METQTESQTKPDIQDFRMRLPRKLHRALRILAVEQRTSLTRLLIRGGEMVLEEETRSGQEGGVA